jgi:hypothetical protein
MCLFVTPMQSFHSKQNKTKTEQCYILCYVVQSIDFVVSLHSCDGALKHSVGHWFAYQTVSANSIVSWNVGPPMLAVRCRLDQISTIFPALLPTRRNAELRESRPLGLHYRPLANMLVTTCGSLIPLGTPSLRTKLELLQIRVDNAVQVWEYKTQNINVIILPCDTELF